MIHRFGMFWLGLFTVIGACMLLPQAALAQARPESTPCFQPEPFWPKPLPGN